MGYAHHSMGYGAAGTGGAEFILHVIIIAVAVIVVVAVLRWVLGGGRMGRMHRMRRWQMMQGMGMAGMHSDALEILRERYAKGEIEKEEFDQKKKDLE